jgi:hypothetical protein
MFAQENPGILTGHSIDHIVEAIRTQQASEP